MTQFGGSGITEPLFDFIIKALPPGARILELGSGDVSTPLLSKLFRLTSIENDPAWVGKYPASRYIHAPIVHGWYDTHILKEQLNQDYELILVDGPLGGIGRSKFADNFHLFRRDVPIVVDDTWRTDELHLARRLEIITRRKLNLFDSFAVV